MAKGTKTFSFAALFFDRERREAARELYAWCRYCDDAIDLAPSKEAARSQFADIHRQTLKALAGNPHPHPAFLGLARLCQSYKIPARYPLELLEGMRTDVEALQVYTEADLILYCYRVAGVVGLMMAQIMGVDASDTKALSYACETGIAMQMTNIARDVKDDFAIGRIYLPASWFDTSPRLSEHFDPTQYASPVRCLLREADLRYAKGRQGLSSLPFRASLAVACAQEIYRDIGRIVLRRGKCAWQTRSFAPFNRKVFLTGKALFLCLISRVKTKGR
jgi:phytoene synthase